MGKRYQAILKYLEVDFSCADKDTSSASILEMARSSSGIIIATPTFMHMNCLEIFSHFKVPVICEKPLSKDLNELIFIKEELVRNRKMNLTMTMQYDMLQVPGAYGESWYDYFRHGSDGLKWDCLQIIGLAKGKISLGEKSPIWKCGLNGRTLSLNDMDGAYCGFVRRWLSTPGDDISRLFDIHMKVMEFQDGQGH